MYKLYENWGGIILENVVYVIGYKNFDLDFICVVYGYVELKNKISDFFVVFVRLGNVNVEM